MELVSLFVMWQVQLQSYWLHQWAVWHHVWAVWVPARCHRSALWTMRGQLLWIWIIWMQTWDSRSPTQFSLTQHSQEGHYHVLNVAPFNPPTLPHPPPPACDCDPEGSQTAQCKEDGRCECRPGFVGARCDMCEENYFYNRSTPGCQQCPSCYSLVRDKVLKKHLDSPSHKPPPFNEAYTLMA